MKKQVMCRVKKFIDIIVDVFLITAVFFITDTMTLKVLHSDSLLLDIGVYILFYAIIFGLKNVVMIILRRFKFNNKIGGKYNEKNR